MANKKQKEKTKAERIVAEAKRLRKLFANLAPNEKAIADGMIQRAAYMRVTLEDYEEELDTFGYVESFCQSEKMDPYDRERPVARLYIATIKNYLMVMKQLKDLLPDGEKITVDDEFDRFDKKR